MGVQERKERERQEIRQLIMDAARELFVEQGYEAVSMRKIAEKIEYSATAIYFHFRDKEALIRALCDHDFLAFAGEFQKIARIKSPIERLRKAGQAYVRFGLEHPQQYRLMFMTPHPGARPEESEIEKGNPEEDAYAFLKSIIVDALVQKLLKKQYRDVDLVSQTVWAGVHGVVSLNIAKCEEEWVDWSSIEKRTRLMIDVLIDGLFVKGK